MLIDEKMYEDHLRKMRNPKMEPLRKTELAKVVVKKCSGMASQRPVTCRNCGYLNGMNFLTVFWLEYLNKMMLFEVNNFTVLISFLILHAFHLRCKI